MKLSVRETETIIVRSPKQVIILIFIPLIFFLLFIFPASISDFILSLLPFLILEINTNCFQSHYTTRTAPRVVCSTKLSPVLRDSYLDGWPKTNTPCGNNFFFFSFPFEGDVKDCRTPQPCVMSILLFLNYLFLVSPCRHSRVYLQYRTIVQIHSKTRRRILLNSLDFWSSKTSSVKTNPRYDIPH